jgi:hypothetical protein
MIIANHLWADLFFVFIYVHADIFFEFHNYPFTSSIISIIYSIWCSRKRCNVIGLCVEWLAVVIEFADTSTVHSCAWHDVAWLDCSVSSLPPGNDIVVTKPHPTTPTAPLYEKSTYSDTVFITAWSHWNVELQSQEQCWCSELHLAA